jgi:cytochrome P450
MRGDTFQKPKGTQEALGRIFGKGLLVAEGAAHRAQRKVINPAFGPGQVRDLSGIFLDKANEVCALLCISFAAHIARSCATSGWAR